MKKLITMFLIAASIKSAAQCHTVGCTQTISISGNSPTNTVGDACYSGSGIITEVGQDMAWKERSFIGDLFVEGRYKTPDSARVNTKGNVSMEYLKTSLGLIIQVEGELNLDTMARVNEVHIVLVGGDSKIKIEGQYRDVGVYDAYQVTRCFGSTGIEELHAAKKTKGRPGIYNLLGQRLPEEPTGQIYIKDGVKKYKL